MLSSVKRSIKEECIADVEAVLKTIKTVNGYDVNIESVQRFNVGSQSTSPSSYIIIIQDDVVFLSESNPHVEKRVFIDLHVSVVQAESEDLGGDSIMNIYEANIGKALQAAPDRGGFANDTSVLSVTALSVPNGERRLEALMRFSIDYKHRREDHTVI